MSEPAVAKVVTVAAQPGIVDPVWVKIFVAAAVGAGFTLLGRMVWAYFQGSQVEKAPIFVPYETCRANRDSCAVNELKTNLATFKAETRAHREETDKRLNENNHEIREMRRDISKIRESQASSHALLETIAKKIETK